MMEVSIKNLGREVLRQLSKVDLRLPKLVKPLDLALMMTVEVF